MKETIREDFWNNVREFDLFMRHLRDNSRHIGGIKFSEEFEKSYEKFKKIILEIDELLATYCGQSDE